MEEVARGEIRSARFYLNGCWAPLQLDKLLAGLLDAGAHCASAESVAVAERWPRSSSGRSPGSIARRCRRYSERNSAE